MWKNSNKKKQTRLDLNYQMTFINMCDDFTSELAGYVTLLFIVILQCNISLGKSLTAITGHMCKIHTEYLKMQSSIF